MNIYIYSGIIGFVQIFIGVALTSTHAVDVYINEITDYNGIRVLFSRLSKFTLFQHQPEDGSYVTRVFWGVNVNGPSLLTYAPSFDVLTDGTAKYFKIKNVDWSVCSPFSGNKYIYYKVENNELVTCNGPQYMEIYQDTFQFSSTLHMWQRQWFVNIIRTVDGYWCNPRGDTFIQRVCVYDHTLWEYDGYKGIIFVRALIHKIHGRTIVVLYFKDLNDNEIELHYIVWMNRIAYLSPWKGYPRKYDVHSGRLPSPSVLPTVEPVPLVINAFMDIADTPLLKVRNTLNGDEAISIYITHPDAYINEFISPLINLPHDDKRIFLAVYRSSKESEDLRVLSYANGANTMYEITSYGVQNEYTQVTDPNVVLYSFAVYANAKQDERMYTKKDITIEGVQSVVFTAKPHLAFSQVYHDGVPVFVEDDSSIPIKQFILQDSRVYIVVRAEDNNGYERYFRGRGDSAWRRARDEYPDYIPS